MIPNILLPRFFKWIGLVLLVSGYVMAFTYDRDPDDVTHPQGLLLQVAILTGLLLIAGARQKMEDEMIKHIRLTSLQWSVFVFIALRVIYKCVAFYNADASWLPQWQVNSLLLFYLILFYYQAYIKDYAQRLLKKQGK